ncbi:hypothetical protein [Blastococcus tunisiensis]|uniref:hypothetical protein n=1 Tax=Blastococcus tunisiensis TaxID=1798228 RepID=UPI001113BD74|nr:hypothetical protein [Blastococcus sp. DSM 46838]
MTATRPASPARHGAAGPVKVWCWWAHDSALAEDLVFIVAVRRRTDLADLCRQWGAGKPELARPLHPGERGYSDAMLSPEHLLWMTLDRFVNRAHTWRNEEQLATARAAPVTEAERSIPPRCRPTEMRLGRSAQ